MSGSTPTCPDPSYRNSSTVSPTDFADHLPDEHDLPALGRGAYKGESSTTATIEGAMRWNNELDALTDRHRRSARLNSCRHAICILRMLLPVSRLLGSQIA